jgi:hypothetical protein
MEYTAIVAFPNAKDGNGVVALACGNGTVQPGDPMNSDCPNKGAAHMVRPLYTDHFASVKYFNVGHAWQKHFLELKNPESIKILTQMLQSDQIPDRCQACIMRIFHLDREH